MITMINILHINSYYIGTKLHRIMISHLDNYDVKNQVFVPTSRKGYSYKAEEEGLLISKCFSRFDRFFYRNKQTKIFKSLTENIDVTRFDIVHAYTVFADGYSAYKIYKRYGIPYVVAVRDTDLNVFFKYFINLRSIGVEVIKNASRVYFLSKPYMEELLTKYIPSSLHADVKAKAKLMPNGIDDFWHENEYEQARSLSCTDINIICVGRINHRKNIPSIQKAVSLLNKRGVNTHLLVIGQVENKRLHKKIAKDVNTEYKKPMLKEDLIKYYRECDLFVLPSFTETFGLVYAEALSQGLPIIYSKGQGFDEQFPNGFVGYSIDPKSVTSIEKGILDIVNRYSDISNRTVESSRVFSWDKICEAYFNDYRDILDRNDAV